MSDLVNDVKYLRYFHTSQDSLKDKDILKNKEFHAFSERVRTLFLVPLGF